MKLFYILLGSLLISSHASAAEITAQSGSASHTAVNATVSSLSEVGGRVLTLYTEAESPQKLWAGTTHGGLWHSTDSGQSWKLATGLMKNMAVGSVAVDPINDAAMYAGTGEGRSNKADLRGHGMFKSSDGGRSWSLLPLTDPAKVGDSWSHINSIAISTAGVILAATSDDKYNGFIYRSTDGGNTWGILPVYTGSKVGPHNIIYKVKFDPDNPDTALFIDGYANVTHSSDGGITWSLARKGKTCP